MEIDANTIVSGIVQSEHKPQLSNPWLKITLVFAPLLAGTLLTPFAETRGISISLNIAALLALTFYFVSLLDFRDDWRIRTLVRFIFIAIIASACVLSETVPFLESLLSFVGAMPIIGWLGLRTWLVLGLFLIAALAIRLVSARDAALYGRKLTLDLFAGRASEKAFLVYITIMATYFVTVNSIEHRLLNAWEAARFKEHLFDRDESRLKIAELKCRTFLKVLLINMQELVELARSILEERGFFLKKAGKWSERDFSKITGLRMRNEDLAGILILAFVAISIVVVSQ